MSRQLKRTRRDNGTDEESHLGMSGAKANGMGGRMKAKSQALLVLVTCANLKEARAIAQNVVGKRLAACVNILPASMESIYRWKGKIESTRELLMLIKTT